MAGSDRTADRSRKCRGWNSTASWLKAVSGSDQSRIPVPIPCSLNLSSLPRLCQEIPVRRLCMARKSQDKVIRLLLVAEEAVLRSLGRRSLVRLSLPSLSVTRDAD